MIKLSFVIPCYCSEKIIGIVINQIKQTVKKEHSYEIICINDDSLDDTMKVLKDMSKKDKHIKVISFSKNYGQHSALLAGYRYATGDIIISLDDDGQTPVADCYKLIEKLSDQYDVVYAKYPLKKHSYLRNIGTLINKKMTTYLLNFPKNMVHTSYFVAKHFVINEIIRYNNSFPYITGLVIRATDKIGNVEIEHKERVSGKSGYTLKKLFSLWLNGFTAFSVKPLRLASLLGVFFSIFGFILGIIVIIRKLIYPHIAAGYSSIMSVMLVSNGILMLILGVLGEYIGRTYICINNAPQYVIRETINIGEYKDEV